MENCPTIEKVNINSPIIQDFSGLYYLEKLRTLYLENPDGEVDLRNFNKLEELSIDWNKNVKGLAQSKNLISLSLWKYNPKNKNLEDLGSLSNLKELTLTQSQISSLQGCGSLEKLEKLELNNLSKLEFIDELEKNCNTLKSLWFESCKKIINHEYVTCLKKLESLAFVKCGEIPSIHFIKSLLKLKSFVFVGTNIVDGDLSPCLGLEYVGFLDKRHYSHKRSDFIK